MKVVFIGNVVPQNIFKQISTVSPSTNNVQLSYIKALNERYGEDIEVISRHLGISNLVDDSVKNIPQMTFETDDKINITVVGFKKSKMFSNLNSVLSLRKELKKLRKTHKDERYIFIVNNHFYGAALPAFWAKKKQDVFITIMNEGFDLRYLYEHRIGIKDYIFNAIHKYILSKNDGIITFNEATVKKYSSGVPYINLLHSCDIEMFDEVDFQEVTNSYRVLYAGSLSPCYGIKNLIAAMEFLPRNYELIICGGGDLASEKYIKQAEDKDTRIHFKGMIPRSEVLRLEREADVLSIIRVAKTKSEKYLADYCQPSKLPEYMLSGTPIIATDILGIPKVIKSYLNFTDSEPSKIAEIIMNVCVNNRHECLKKAVDAKAYAEKNCTYQMQKELICRFIDSIVGE